jgi:hypothetical protein
MINFIIENQSLIKSYMEIEEEEYDTKKLYIIQNEMWKIFCTLPESNSQLRKYYRDLEENELYLAIRKDFVEYTFEKQYFDEVFFEKMNNYLDSILRKDTSVDSSKSYWGVLFSDSFYDYGGVMIYNHNNQRDKEYAIQLEIVFLFDDRNKIKMVNLCLLIP